MGLQAQTHLSDMQQLQWEKVAPGVWKAQMGSLKLNAFDYAAPPKLEGLQNLGEADFPFDVTATLGQKTPSLFSVRMPLGESEKIYGLGLEFQGLNRRKNVYALKVDHYGGVKGFTHAPVPFYVSSAGYGVLINAPQRVKIHVGVGNHKDGKNPAPIDRTTGENWPARPQTDAIEANVAGSGLEVYVFAGKNPLEVVQRYNLFSGGGALPPKWGLGFWHRLHTKSSDADVMAEIEAFEEHDFPLDVVGLEPGWQSFAYPCSFDWDPGRFPNPEQFVQDLADKNIKVNLWENPYIAPSSTLFNDIKPYTGSHMVWLGEVPDYTLPKARELMLDHHQKNHISLGVSGYKIDEVDGYDQWLWPDHATFPSGNDAVEIRQLYGLIMQDAFDDHFKKQNKRTYNLVRSSYVGAASKNAVIYSDYYGHKGYVTALVNSSMAGLLWTPEIRNARSGEEWIRRFQTVCFSPLMMLNAWSSGKKPWSFPEVTDMARDVINLRKRMLPYLYTAFHDYQTLGIPPFRAMVLEDGYTNQESLSKAILDGVKNPYAEQERLEVTDQYMMGPSLLVAPVFWGDEERKVVLPKGNWYDFYTGKYAGNGETITITTELSKIPLYVKDGGIIPMLSGGDENSLEVRHYGDKPSTYTLYNDDGVSYDYEKGAFAQTQLQATAKKDKWKGSAKATGEKAYQYRKMSWVWMGKE